MKLKEVCDGRVEKLRGTIKDRCDALVIDNPIDIYYLTGIHLSTGRLIVCENTCLIVDGRYTEMCERHSPFPVRSAKETLQKTLCTPVYSKIRKLGFDRTNTTYSAYEKMVYALEALRKLDPDRAVELVPLDAPVLHVRAVKDSGEIESLRKAAELGSKGYDFAVSKLREGMREVELALELEIFWRRSGASGVAFDPIIAFGENSSMPHYRAGDRALRKGDIVLIDIGVTLGNYHSDMTRTVFFGTPDPRLLEIHDVVCHAQIEALKLCKPGVAIGTIDAAARDLIAARGYGDNFNHGLGHGIGLEVHELPILKNMAPYDTVKLEKGMAITIEPGIYLPGLGGVRIEDTIVITEDGHENLTQRAKSHRGNDA